MELSDFYKRILDLKRDADALNDYTQEDGMFEDETTAYNSFDKDTYDSFSKLARSSAAKYSPLYQETTNASVEENGSPVNVQWYRQGASEAFSSLNGVVYYLDDIDGILSDNDVYADGEELSFLNEDGELEDRYILQMSNLISTFRDFYDTLMTYVEFVEKLVGFNGDSDKAMRSMNSGKNKRNARKDYRETKNVSRIEGMKMALKANQQDDDFGAIGDLTYSIFTNAQTIKQVVDDEIYTLSVNLKPFDQSSWDELGTDIKNQIERIKELHEKCVDYDRTYANDPETRKNAVNFTGKGGAQASSTLNGVQFYYEKVSEILQDMGTTIDPSTQEIIVQDQNKENELVNDFDSLLLSFDKYFDLFDQYNDYINNLINSLPYFDGSQ